MKELKAKRLPLLEKRETAQKAGDAKVVEECNGELRKLNLAIQGVQPYVEPKAPMSNTKTARKGGKKSTEDVLA